MWPGFREVLASSAGKVTLLINSCCQKNPFGHLFLQTALSLLKIQQMLIFCAFYLLRMIYTTLFLKCVFYLAAKCFSLPVQFSRWVWRVQLNVIWASVFLPASLHGSLNQHQHFSGLCNNPVVCSFLIISSFSHLAFGRRYVLILHLLSTVVDCCDVMFKNTIYTAI